VAFVTAHPEKAVLEAAAHQVGLKFPVDMVGGSAHLEDLMLITADGSEAINDVGDEVIVV
jgi:hypothetical protein